METWQARTEMVIGSGAVSRLALSRIALFGVGGVGGSCADALARSGIGSIDLIDMDTVEETNLNRQFAARRSTLGRMKTEVMKEHILDINPSCLVTCRNIFYLPETASLIDLSGYDFIIDAIDTVTAKICLIEGAIKEGVPVISCMGTGNRLDPSKLTVTDISKTHTDPLSKVMRVELRKRGIEHLPVVFSEESPVKSLQGEKQRTPGSAPFVPQSAGILLASYAVRSLITKL